MVPSVSTKPLVAMKYPVIFFVIACLIFAWFYTTRHIETCTLDFTKPQTSQHHDDAKASSFNARDGHALGYRFLSGKSSDNLIIILHGSSYHGAYLVPLAQEISSCGDVCIPDIRGHGLSSPPKGTCSYIGQLEDDLFDLITNLKNPYKKITLIGHSSGGGFAIRFASGKYKSMVHTLILLSPAIITAPTMNTVGAHSWAHVDKITLAECITCNAFGIKRFNKKPLITFNKPKEMCDGSETLTYDYNLVVSMHPRIPYEKDLKAIQDRSFILVGRNDEMNSPEAFKKLFKPERVTILETLHHMNIVSNPSAISAVKTLLKNQNSA